MSDNDQDPSCNAECPDDQHNFTAARASQGSGPTNLAHIRIGRRRLGEPRYRRHHPPHSLPVIPNPESTLDYISTDDLINELCARSDHCVVMQYRDLDEAYYGLRLWTTPSFSTPDEIVDMIGHTLDSFGFTDQTGDPQ